MLKQELNKSEANITNLKPIASAIMAPAAPTIPPVMQQSRNSMSVNEPVPPL